MTDLCKREMEDADAIALRQIIRKMLIETVLLNATNGLMIDT